MQKQERENNGLSGQFPAACVGVVQGLRVGPAQAPLLHHDTDGKAAPLMPAPIKLQTGWGHAHVVDQCFEISPESVWTSPGSGASLAPEYGIAIFWCRR